MSAARRNQELANDLARRAIAAAERRRAAELGTEGVAERLRQAADDEGRVSVDEALDALAGDHPHGPFNPLAEHEARQQAKQEARRRRLFPSSAEREAEPPSKPQGSAGGGEGEPVEIEIDYRDGQPFQVFDLDQLSDDTKGT